jgi:hypothetical protein
MTKKKRGRGKKSSSPKQLQQPSLADEQSSTFQTSEVESDEEQLDERNGSTAQNTPISVADKDCGRAENAHSKEQISDCSGDVAASLEPVECGLDKGRQQLEVGLSQIASIFISSYILRQILLIFVVKTKTRERRSRAWTTCEVICRVKFARKARWGSTNRDGPKNGAN